MSRPTPISSALAWPSESRRLQGPPEIAIRGLDLAAPSLNVRVFMLPQVQWEPVVTPPNPAAPFPEKLFSVSDGGSALIGTNSVNLVPVAPIPIAEELLHAIRDPERNAAVLFTLPFGIKAVVRIIAERLGQFDFVETVRLLSNRPEFGPLLSARQFRLEPGGVIASEGMPLPGAAIQRNAIDPLDRGASASWTICRATTWAPRAIPQQHLRARRHAAGRSVSRVDLSGYGESCFSLWTDKHSPPPKVSITSPCVTFWERSHAAGMNAVSSWWRLIGPTSSPTTTARGRAPKYLQV